MTSTIFAAEPHSALHRAEELPRSRMAALLRDCTNLLRQQMYFWGRDVLHPEGNLLCKHGFEKRKSHGLEGTSCYRKFLKDGGLVELHGACAGYYREAGNPTPNLLYIRERNRCFLYSEEEPPAPGFYNPKTLDSGTALAIYEAGLPFLNWWLDYENWVGRNTPSRWRLKNYEAFASLPAARPLLPPAEAKVWLAQFLHDPTKSIRIRERMRELRA